MSKSILHPILINRGRNIVCDFFKIITNISHRNTDTSLFNDGNIIAAIAESHGFIYVLAQIISHCLQPFTFISLSSSNIGKSRMPSSGSTIFQ